MASLDPRFLPAYGLSGAPLRFDPGTLCVHSELPHNEFRLFSLNPSSKDWNAEPADDRARVMHEFDHLVRTLSTSHGIVRHSLVSLLCASAIQYVSTSEGILQRTFPLELPGHPLVQIARTAGGNVGRLLTTADKWHPAHRHLLRYVCYRQLLDAWDGRRPALPHLLEAGLALFEAAVRGGIGSDGNTPRFLSPWDDNEVPEWRAIHDLSDYVSPFIGAAAMYESFAVETELIFAQRFGRTKQNSTDLLGGELYRVSAELFHRVFLNRGTRRVPLEFDAVLGLSLWVPFTLHGTAMRTETFHWSDLEPGHRFLRAIGELLDMRYDDWHYGEEESDPGGCDAPIIEIQETLAARLNWPTPQALNDILTRQLKSIDQRGDCPSAYAVIEKASPRISWVLRLLGAARDAPFSSFYRLIQEKFASTGIYFPAILCTDKIVVNTGLLFEEATSHLSERYILAGSQMLIDGAAHHAFTRSEAIAALELIAGYGQSLLGDQRFPEQLKPWRAEITGRPSDLPPIARSNRLFAEPLST